MPPIPVAAELRVITSIEQENTLKTPSTKKPDEFTLAQAAETLGVSEAYLKEELINTGKLNCISNQIKAADLREYGRQLEKQREAAMQELADIAQ